MTVLRLFHVAAGDLVSYVVAEHAGEAHDTFFDRFANEPGITKMQIVVTCMPEEHELLFADGDPYTVAEDAERAAIDAIICRVLDSDAMHGFWRWHEKHKSEFLGASRAAGVWLQRMLSGESGEEPKTDE